MTLNDELANDRTYLAWVRTAIALYALGFVVAKVAYLINTDPAGLSDRDFYTVVGVLIIVCGAATVLTGFWQHRAVIRAYASEHAVGDEARPRPQWPLVMTITSVAGALVLSLLIVVSSN